MVKHESASHSVVSNSLQPHGLYSSWNSPGQNHGVGSLSLLQGIFPTQSLKPVLSHCRQILYQLSHKGSPRTLQWVAYPFSSESSWLRNRSGISCIAGRFSTNWAIKEALISIKCHLSRGAFPNHICKRAHLLRWPTFTLLYFSLHLIFNIVCMALFSPYTPNPCTNKFHECWNLGLFYSLLQPQYLTSVRRGLTCSRNSTVVDGVNERMNRMLRH